VHCDHTVHFTLVQCSGYPDIKGYQDIHLLPAVFFQSHLEDRWGMEVQTRRDISKTVDDRS